MNDIKLKRSSDAKFKYSKKITKTNIKYTVKYSEKRRKCNKIKYYLIFMQMNGIVFTYYMTFRVLYLRRC